MFCSEIIKTYYTFSYYFMCTPYKYRRSGKGTLYTVHSWWPQTVCCYGISMFYLGIIFRRCVDQWANLLMETRQESGNLPISYLNLLESATYLHYSIAVTYAQNFHGPQILKFLNKLLEHSEHHAALTKPNSKSIGRHSRKLFCRNPSIMVKLGLALITTIALLNTFIYYNLKINYKKAVDDTLNFILWGNAPNSYDEKMTSTNNLIVTVHTIFGAFRDLRDMYVELFFISGIASLYMVSSDFQKYFADDEMNMINEETNPKKITNSAYSAYKSLARLSRLFSKGHGYALFSYLMYYLMYYSVKLDSLFLPGGGGMKFYITEYFGTFIAVLVLGGGFSYKVSLMKRLTNRVQISINLSDHQCHMLSHWHCSDYVAVKAKLFPVTFAILTHFVAQVMVTFLICVQSKVTQK